MLNTTIHLCEKLLEGSIGVVETALKSARSESIRKISVTTNTVGATRLILAGTTKSSKVLLSRNKT